MQKFIFFATIIICYSCESLVPEKDQRPNILFIQVDDLTAKYMGFFGADFAKTPNLDSLASSGVVFNNAVVQGTMCTPSRNSLITGMYPHNMDLYENLDLFSLPKDTWTFPKALKKEGYKTFWVGKNHLLPYINRSKVENTIIDRRNKAVQVEMGFDDVYQTLGKAMVLDMAQKQFAKDSCWEEGRDAYADFLFENGLLDTLIKEGYNIPTTLDPDTEMIDGHFTSIVIDKIGAYKGNSPFFMWVNYSGPHSPFNVPKEYLDMFELKDMPDVIDRYCETFDIPKELKQHPIPEELTAMFYYRKKYSAAISYMDAQAGRLIDFINSSRFKDNTIIVFFSDHGIMTGDHGLVGKSTLFKEVLNPSLVISYPKEYKPQRVTIAVELLDLGKTVLDIAGVPKETLDEIPNGNSLLPLLNGNGQFAGSGIGFSELRGLRSAFNGDYKYIDHPETPILFNLKEDPYETQNMIEKEPEMAAHLKKAMDQWFLSSGSLLIKGIK